MQDYGGYFRYAQDYYYSGNYESALEYANYALRYDPYNDEIIYFKDRLLTVMDATEDEEDDEEDDEDESVTHFNNGESYYDEKEYEDAITEYTAAIELDPYYAEAYNKRGICYFNLEKYKKSIADYTKVIKLDPNYTYAYYNRGFCYKRMESYNKAIKDFTKAIELDDDSDSDMYNERGLCYYALGEFEMAADDLTKAMECEPDCACLYNNRGDCYYSSHKYKEAVADYKKAIEIGDTEERMNRWKLKLGEIDELLNAPVKLSDCTEIQLSMLEVFDANRIEKFMQARENRITWYSMDSFAEYFKLQPHEVMQIEKRIIFPLKPANKLGRKIDF